MHFLGLVELKNWNFSISHQFLYLLIIIFIQGINNVTKMAQTPFQLSVASLVEELQKSVYKIVLRCFAIEGLLKMVKELQNILLYFV